jgi:tRNA U55 pseudouridine synthase TruB
MFTGDIRQVPPQFSAVKVDGNRAYDIARSGETMELAARDLYVDELSLLSCPDADHASSASSAVRAAMSGPSPAISAKRWAALAMW